jgi:hypothetical protein
LVAPLIALLIIFFGTAAAHADFVVGDRINRTSGCPGDDWADPVNVLYRDNGDNDRSVNHFMAHIGWSNQEGSWMYLWHHNQFCQALTAQRASGSGTSSRDHIRFFNVNDSDPTYGLWTAAAIHFDQVCGLTHTGRSFNIERDNLVSAFNGAPDHPSDTIQWVGSYSIYLPCPDIFEPVDGKLGRISIPSYFH